MATSGPVATPAPAPLASILVIDDEEDLRMLNRAALEDAGFRVETAGDGIEALLKLGGNRYDLVLSDVDMPNLDGFQLLAALSSKGIQTPVIFLTGRSDAENEVRGLELGAEDYLHKPVLPPVLLARVKMALAKRR
jgi:two-component system copper resistance phosphate regulon response regulator CusR